MEPLDRQLAEEMAAYLEAADAAGRRHAYALVDTNQEPNLNVILDGMARRVRPLSKSAPDGPVLVELDPAEGTLPWLLTEKRGRRLAIFLFSAHDFDDLWSHARRFTKIVKPDGEEASFRFYDPHAFNQYFGVLSEEQRRAVFARVDRVYAEYGPYLMRTEFDAETAAIRWRLFADEDLGEQPRDGVASLPAIDLTGSRATPLFHLSKAQYEYPIIFNMPALVADVDAYLRPDFEQRMNCYAPGFLRAMIEAAMRVALHGYELRDLEILRQFAELQWRIAPGFYKQPDIDRLLGDAALPPQERWSRLLSAEYEDALVDAFHYDRTEDWGLPFD